MMMIIIIIIIIMHFKGQQDLIYDAWLLNNETRVPKTHLINKIIV
jgi:hypothetical protein